MYLKTCQKFSWKIFRSKSARKHCPKKKRDFILIRIFPDKSLGVDLRPWRGTIFKVSRVWKPLFYSNYWLLSTKVRKKRCCKMSAKHLSFLLLSYLSSIIQFIGWVATLYYTYTGVANVGLHMQVRNYGNLEEKRLLILIFSSASSPEGSKIVRSALNVLLSCVVYGSVTRSKNFRSFQDLTTTH